MGKEVQCCNILAGGVPWDFFFPSYKKKCAMAQKRFFYCTSSGMLCPSEKVQNSWLREKISPGPPIAHMFGQNWEEFCILYFLRRGSWKKLEVARRQEEDS